MVCCIFVKVTERKVYKDLISGGGMKTKLSKFIGRPLMKMPEFIPSVNFLTESFAKEFLKEYNERVQFDYGNNPVLNVLNYDEGVVKGSNPYAVSLANQILRQENLRTATHVDLEKILKINVLELQGVSEDTGLILRRGNFPNELAQDLTKQLEERGYKLTKKPLVIWLNQLELETDENCPDGLKFELLENCEPFYSPILNKNGRFSSEDVNEKTGFPMRLRGGERYLYGKGSGLSKLNLMRDLWVSSIDHDLKYSNSRGRIVVIDDKATTNKISGSGHYW